MAERRSPKPQVGGSIPSWPATIRQLPELLEAGMADKIKLTLAVLVVSGAIGAFYYYADHSMLLRVIGILVAMGISTAIAMQTAVGQKTLGFIRESKVEVRKVVWPTRKETLQTTLIVMVMVVVVAIFLWLVDMFLLWAVRFLTGQGG